MTLNRPDNRNSMTEEVLEGVAARVREARADQDLRCLVVTGEGRSFCAGADFKSQIQREQPGRQPHERSYAMYEPFLSSTWRCRSWARSTGTRSAAASGSR